MPSQYEIEIKSLLGEKEKADNLKAKLLEKGATLKIENKQLNHYFLLEDAERFKNSFDNLISTGTKEKFDHILEHGSNFSVRTRYSDLATPTGYAKASGKVLLVIKASVDEDSSANGVSRMEFEEEVSMTIDELDQKLLDAGLKYQAKWSRERQEYALGDVNVCIDRNAGYGYLAEFEIVVNDEGVIGAQKERLVSIMSDFGVKELKQDRLERMFAHYNEHWQEYYGTDKVFNIE